MKTGPAMKIGEFFVERKFMTSEQVEEILYLQRYEVADRFGQIALLLDYINSDAMNRYEAYINSM